MQDDTKTVVIRGFYDVPVAGRAQAVLSESAKESFLSHYDSPTFTNPAHYGGGFKFRLYINEKDVPVGDNLLHDVLEPEQNKDISVDKCPYCFSNKIFKIKDQSKYYNLMNSLINSLFLSDTQIYRKDIYICTFCSKKFKLEVANWE